MTPSWRIDLFAAPSDSSELVPKHLLSLKHQVRSHHDLSTEKAEDVIKEKTDLLLLISASDNFDAFIQLIQTIRSISSTIPVFHLDTEDHFSRRVQSLKAGADDVLSSPFALEELDARLEALIRRNSGVQQPGSTLRTYADLELNTDNREVKRSGVTEKLTVKEFDLLMFFLERPGKAMPRKTILQGVWGQSWTGDDNLLEVYIRYLRKKVERPGHDTLIQTVRGVGYMLR